MLVEADTRAGDARVEPLSRNAWHTATPDWERRIMEGRPLIPRLPLNEEYAAKALRIFKRLRVPDIPGNPRFGEVCGQWVFDFVRAVFGSYDPETRRRMIREFFLLVPKKNAKTTIAAAIIVTAAILNERPSAELLLIAPTKKIADISYGQAAGIIACDRELKKVFHASDHQRQIKHRISKAVIQIKAADTDVITGSKATYILIDETHVFAQKANAAGVFVEIRGSLAARPDGFLLQITTQSKTPPAGVFKTELNLARDVRDNRIALPLLPVLYELPPAIAKDGGWKDPKTWPLVNPNLNRSLDENFLRDEVLKAERDGPDQLALIASQHFNVEVGLALQQDRWGGADYWIGAADESIARLEAVMARSEVVTVGIDGGGLDDLFGICVIGRCKTTRDWLAWHHVWAHPDVFERRKEIAATLKDFHQDGDITVCTEATQDVREAAEICERLLEAGLLPKENAIGLDTAGEFSIVDELAQRGIAGDMPKHIGQDWRLAPAIYGVERKLKNGTFWHGGRRMMAWVVGNMKVMVRGGAVAITKQTSGRAKIDPGIAMFNAAMLMARNPAAVGEPKYQMIFV